MALPRGFITVSLAFFALKLCLGSDNPIFEILQFLAHELSDEDCHTLLVSQKIRRQEDAAFDTKAPLGNVTCLEGLLLWNSLEGSKATLSALAPRLRKLGRFNLAEAISCEKLWSRSDSLAASADRTPKGLKNNSTFIERQEPTTFEEEWTYILTVTLAVLNVLMIVLSVITEVWSCALGYENQDEALREDKDEDKAIEMVEELKDT